MELSGQWIARYSGSNNGTVVIDIDDVGNRYKGSACVWDDAGLKPNAVIRFETKSKARAHKISGVSIEAVDNYGNHIDARTLEQIKQTAGLEFPEKADIEIHSRGQDLAVIWTTSIQTCGSATAVGSKARAGIDSEMVPLKINTWDKFKKHVNRLERKRYVFRGQENSAWRLRTSFHRSGRTDLDRFTTRDVAELQKAFSALTQKAFDLNNPLHYGAFINLAQHHGYPTPMLDWTWSPYVAAFFAFRKIKMNVSSATTSKVRIYKLDLQEWNNLPRGDKLFPIWPNVSVLDALAMENPRVVPQQAIVTTTNLDDIESYIQQVEYSKGRQYLEAIDLPVKDRQNIMHELALMGITAGSLFPGLDGACESLKEFNF